jgi:hypothetical protein
VRASAHARQVPRPTTSTIAPLTRPARLPRAVVQALRRPRLVVLATASADGHPSTTVVSWVYAWDERRLVVALDRRGVALSDVVENPHAAIELLLPGFVASLRGSVRVLCERLVRAGFPCAAVLFEVNEIRDHAVAGVVVEAPDYWFAPEKGHHASAEAEILRELRELCAHRTG